VEPRTVPTGGEPLPAEAPAEILARIDVREREIERALHDARETAAAIVQEARNRAQALVSARRAQAAREAAELGARIEVQARQSAEEILAAAARDSAAVRATSGERIARAAEGLLAVVLPSGPAGGEGR
jgi:vacuolar-type H+-ATPase subunit H